MDKIIICSFDGRYLPERKLNSVGWDCKALVNGDLFLIMNSGLCYEITNTADGIVILPNSRLVIPMGFRVVMPLDCHADIRPRSGLALSHGVTVLNSPGLIDPDFRGMVSTILINHGQQPFAFKNGDRICQMVFSRGYPVELVVDPDLFVNFEQVYPTARGDAGFGSTGR